MKLTGKDIHQAYCAVRPQSVRSWRRISKAGKRLYRELARELNRELDARQAWFEGEDDIVTIVAVRCSACGQMLECAHCEGHACWLEVR